MTDIIIVGGGPAGMTAALYAQRNGKTALVLEKAGFLFKKVLATENVELTNQYGVKQAPTLVVLGPANGEFTKYKGVSEIKGMLTARQVG